jgi:hypothetical protein
MSLNFTFSDNFSTTVSDNYFDTFVFDSRYYNFSRNLSSYMNFYEEKLLIYSILFTDFMFNITAIILEYYIDNTSLVNIILLSVFFVYKIYCMVLKSIENSNFAIKNICNELFENVEKLIIKNIQLSQEKEKIYKLLLLEKESNIQNMQYNYINKNLSDIQSDIMKIKTIIDDNETRAVKKIPLVSSVINRLTKNLKNHKIVINNDDQIILLSDIEL